jgi:hypothetical protein
MLSVFVVTLPIVPRTATLVIPCPKFSEEGTSALAISSVCQEFVIWFNLVRNQVNMLCLLLASWKMSDPEAARRPRRVLNSGEEAEHQQAPNSKQHPLVPCLLFKVSSNLKCGLDN